MGRERWHARGIFTICSNACCTIRLIGIFTISLQSLAVTSKTMIVLHGFLVTANTAVARAFNAAAVGHSDSGYAQRETAQVRVDVRMLDNRRQREDWRWAAYACVGGRWRGSRLRFAHHFTLRSPAEMSIHPQECAGLLLSWRSGRWKSKSRGRASCWHSYRGENIRLRRVVIMPRPSTSSVPSPSGQWKNIFSSLIGCSRYRGQQRCISCISSDDLPAAIYYPQDH